MASMAKHRGHFYNWYDTADLRPLDPQYVSSVDSSSWPGHLIALANACEEWTTRVFPLAARIAGVVDCVALAHNAAKKLPDGASEVGVLAELRIAASACASRDDLAALRRTIDEFAARVASIDDASEPAGDFLFWVRMAQTAITAHSDASDQLTDALSARLRDVAQSARAMAMAMEFGFLLDHDRKLLSIGFIAPEGVLDPNYYDLLASEARLASFFAIAKGDIPTNHWFRLGRSVTAVGNGAALISWSGSMF